MFSETEETFKQCPWDQAHSMIAPRKFSRHVLNCPSKGRDPNLVQCPYDLSHVYRRNGEAEHMENCPLLKRAIEEARAHSSALKSPQFGNFSPEPDFDFKVNKRRSNKVQDGWGSGEDDSPLEDRNAKKKFMIFQNPSEWKKICFDPESGVFIRPLDKIAYSRLDASEKINYNQALRQANKAVADRDSGSSFSAQSVEDFPPLSSSSLSSENSSGLPAPAPKRLALGRGQRFANP